MSTTDPTTAGGQLMSPRMVGGLIWLAVALAGAAAFFWDGIDALLAAWQTAEYSHGPLIPLLSGFMFLRQLSHTPPHDGPVNDRWAGVAVIALSLFMALVGKLAGVAE